MTGPPSQDALAVPPGASVAGAPPAPSSSSDGAGDGAMIVAATCESLQSLAMSDAHGATARSMGFLPLVVEALRRFGPSHADAAARTCGTLANLAMTDAAEAEIVGLGALPLVVAAMLAHPHALSVQVRPWQGRRRG